MDNHPKRRRLFVLRLIVGLALLGWPRVGVAQGTWSVISLPQKSGEMNNPRALAVDAAGNLYVADGYGSRIQKRDAQGNWSVIATYGTALGQVSGAFALAVDAAGNLYVANTSGEDSRYGGIQKRDAQGNWSVIAARGSALGQVGQVHGLAVDSAGNLYVADFYNNRIQKRDAQGNWSVIATDRADALAADGAGNLYVATGGQIRKRDAQGNWSVVAAQDAFRIAADSAGNLYVADGDYSNARIQKRDAQGNWSVIATGGAAVGQVDFVSIALAVDSTGDLYVADYPYGESRIQRRDARGGWSVIATDGWYPGQVREPTALAVDAAGNLYVADQSLYAYGRIQKRDTQGNWSVIASGADGQFFDVVALAVDAAGNLYIPSGSDEESGGAVQKRDAQGNWSVIASGGWDLGQVWDPRAFAVDAAGSLYVADEGLNYTSRIQKRDAQGNWSEIAMGGTALGQVGDVSGLAVDGTSNLYVAEEMYPLYQSPSYGGQNRIQKRDAQGNWSLIATEGTAPGQVDYPKALAADSAGNLYVAELYYVASEGHSRIQKRDARGNWSVIATTGSALGQVLRGAPSIGFGLAADGAGNLYVADTGNNRVQMYTPAP